VTSYLDASAIIPALVEEPGSGAVDTFMASLSDGMIVSDFAAAEVASAFSRLVRTERLDWHDAASRLSDFDAWRESATEAMALQASDARLAGVFVRRFDLMLRAPDALHLAMCKRGGHRLVTMDRRLAKAAEELGVAAELLG